MSEYVMFVTGETFRFWLEEGSEAVGRKYIAGCHKEDGLSLIEAGIEIDGKKVRVVFARCFECRDLVHVWTFRNRKGAPLDPTKPYVIHALYRGNMFLTVPLDARLSDEGDSCLYRLREDLHHESIKIPEPETDD